MISWQVNLLLLSLLQPRQARPAKDRSGLPVSVQISKQGAAGLARDSFQEEMGVSFLRCWEHFKSQSESFTIGARGKVGQHAFLRLNVHTDQSVRAGQKGSDGF